ncbi:MAG: hypothetical protein R2867_11740 [Caldilineaceae bacterium]
MQTNRYPAFLCDCIYAAISKARVALLFTALLALGFLSLYVEHLGFTQDWV